jgi:hypothetical protein
MRTNLDFADQLEQLVQQINWDETPQLAPAKDDVIAKLQKEIRSTRTEATEHRHVFPQQEQAAAKALAGNDETAKVLRRIEKAEVTKTCYQLLCKCLKPTTRGGITRIEVAYDEVATCIVTEPKDSDTAWNA